MVTSAAALIEDVVEPVSKAHRNTPFPPGPHSRTGTTIGPWRELKRTLIRRRQYLEASDACKAMQNCADATPLPCDTLHPGPRYGIPLCRSVLPRHHL